MKYTNIVLKRGYTQDQSLWNWRKQVIDGTTQRTTGTITLLDEARQPALRLELYRRLAGEMGRAGDERQRPAKSRSRCWKSPTRAWN